MSLQRRHAAIVAGALASIRHLKVSNVERERVAAGLARGDVTAHDAEALAREVVKKPGA